jgi:hypothetical protein
VILTEREASSAIHVDFESLGTNIDRPALLGMLVADAAGDRFQQFVLDAALRGAIVARKRVCVNATSEEAVTTIVDEAERHSRLVVSWSTHECAVVRATCNAALASRFCAVHRNALDVVRPWKRNLYPTFRLAAKRFGGKHPLKEYFRMTGYDLPAKLRPPAPAKWLKHTLQQMKANNGRYVAITKQAKRDWHNLLLYNEHDCRGMRVVTVGAAHELQLWSAYEQTHFVVFVDGHEVAIHAGYRSPRLDALLQRLSASRWAFLTAYNPESAPLSTEENERRQQGMFEELLTAGYRLIEGEGRDKEGKWPAEPSALVLDVDRRKARRIGRKYGQLAILVWLRRLSGAACRVGTATRPASAPTGAAFAALPGVIHDSTPAIVPGPPPRTVGEDKANMIR